VHAYGIIGADEPLTQFPSGIADTSVWVFGVNSLAAIVSLLPVEGFGVTDWERNATNVGWLERVARQHHEVLQYAAITAAVVPLRLPSLYGNLESLRETLHAASDRVERALGRIRGRLEWAVKVYRTAEEQSSAANTASTSGATIYWRDHGISAPEAPLKSGFASKWARYTTPLVRSVRNMWQTSHRMPCCQAIGNRCC